MFETKKWIEEHKAPDIGGCFSVCMFDPDVIGYYTTLYDCIDSLQDAYILAQYSMKAHREGPWQLIFIFPGYNIGIENKPDLWQKAFELKERYKVKEEENK